MLRFKTEDILVFAGILKLLIIPKGVNKCKRKKPELLFR